MNQASNPMPGLSTKLIPPAERLIFALDVADIDTAKTLVLALGEQVQFYKLGLELFMAGGYFELMDWLLQRHKKIFVDLKFFDVPQTVASAVKRLQGRGVSFVTVHGNDSILRAAVDSQAGDCKILAVTVLTSLDRGDLNDLGFACEIEELVYSRAKRALELGCGGIVSSGLEVARLRQQLGDKLVVVTPGIRPVENRPVDDQKRVVTVDQAFLNGADYIVVGRPIKQAANPAAAAAAIQHTIQQLFSGVTPA